MGKFVGVNAWRLGVLEAQAWHCRPEDVILIGPRYAVAGTTRAVPAQPKGVAVVVAVVVVVGAGHTLQRCQPPFMEKHHGTGSPSGERHRLPSRPAVGYSDDRYECLLGVCDAHA